MRLEARGGGGWFYGDYKLYMLIFKFKFNEATPRGVPGPVFKKTPEMPGFTKMTPPRHEPLHPKISN